MTLSELAAFAISGSAATAASALVTDRVSASAKGVSPAKTTKKTATAANGFVFFFTYYVAATTRLRLSSHRHNSTSSTHRAASQAFLIGATAAVCTRLLGPGDSTILKSEIAPEDAPTNAEDAEAPPRYRWSLAALEDDVVLALDPGLTFCIHEILARMVAQRQWRRHASGQQQHHNLNGLYATAITFVLAATSKAVATGITYPLYASATAAEADRRRRWLGKPSEGDVGGDDDDGHTVLSMLWKTVRHPGGIRALYADWLRTVGTAALGHGLIMALQRALYGVILRVVLSLARIIKTRLASSPERMPPSSMQAQQGSLLAGTTEVPRAVPQLPAEPIDVHVDEQQKVTKAVESWLEATTANDTVTAKDIVKDDAPRLLPAAPSTASPKMAVSSQSWKQQFSEPWVDSLQTTQESIPAAPSVNEGALVRYEVSRNTETVSQNQELPVLNNVDNTGNDNDNGNVIFNMISKSPRVLKP
ncbi:hypothetical protein SEUCBS139899_006231 [Sporothrix eucalyptigena]|uniref:Uncharacterized protein n=1 Tax=Sporothrix eucalyptigena TaxID=1812306 RepID=A0ABP0ASF8_9PEZI